VAVFLSSVLVSVSRVEFCLSFTSTSSHLSGASIGVSTAVI